MSPSWTSLAGGSLLPFRSRRCVGIGVGREELWAARVSSKGTRRFRVHWIRSRRLPLALFEGSPTPEVERALTEALGELCAGLNRGSTPVQVAIPDPAATVMAFEIDKLPASVRMQRDWARWRFAKEFSMRVQDIACTCQYLGREGNKHLLLAAAANSEWIRCLEQGLRQAGVLASAIDVDVCHRFNRFHDEIMTRGTGGVLVSLQPAAWSLLAWDAQARLRFVRSRWRRPAPSAAAEEAIDKIASEVERVVRGYARTGSGGDVEQMFVTGADEEIERLARILDGRLRERCTPLPMFRNYVMAPGVTAAQAHAASSALTAAIAR